MDVFMGYMLIFFRNFTFSIVFYCFRHIWRDNLPNIDITALIFCSVQPHFTMIHHLWKFRLFSINRTCLKIRGHKVPPLHLWSCTRSPMWGRVKVISTVFEILPFYQKFDNSSTTQDHNKHGMVYRPLWHWVKWHS